MKYYFVGLAYPRIFKNTVVISQKIKYENVKLFINFIK
jgi:hypothetical protein